VEKAGGVEPPLHLPLSARRQFRFTDKNMNKKLITLVSAAVIAAILSLWAILRLSSIGQSHSLMSDAIAVTSSLLALPLRLYVLFVLGEDGHWTGWSLALLPLLLGLSGLMWGIIVERVTWMFSGRKMAK
jgi:hypothetical protein